jgi:hypothetical protein
MMAPPDDDFVATATRIGEHALRISIPRGWQVIAGEWWTTVQDAAGAIQIHLGVIPKQGRSIEQILESIESFAAQDNPEATFSRQEEAGLWTLWIRTKVARGVPLEQVHVLAAWGDDATVLRAKVSADAGAKGWVAACASRIVRSAEWGFVEEPPVVAVVEPSEELPAAPTFGQRARELEQEDRLEEAETLYRDSIPSLHFAIAIAWMYHDRWVRLKESDPVLAKDARKRASDWAYNYASYATSGGEGAALSWERDQFLKLLGPEPLE